MRYHPILSIRSCRSNVRLIQSLNLSRFVATQKKRRVWPKNVEIRLIYRPFHMT